MCVEVAARPSQSYYEDMQLTSSVRSDARATMGHLHGLMRERVSLVTSVVANNKAFARVKPLTFTEVDTTTTPTQSFEDVTVSSPSISTFQDGECFLGSSHASSPSSSTESAAHISPPTAEALLYGMLQLQRKQRRNRAGVRWYRK